MNGQKWGGLNDFSSRRRGVHCFLRVSGQRSRLLLWEAFPDYPSPTLVTANPFALPQLPSLHLGVLDADYQNVRCRRVTARPQTKHTVGSQPMMGRWLREPDHSEKLHSSPTHSPRRRARGPGAPPSTPKSRAPSWPRQPGGVGLAVIHLPASPLRQACR